MNKEEKDEGREQATTENKDENLLDLLEFVSFLKGKKLLERPNIYA